jgi:Fic family protein
MRLVNTKPSWIWCRAGWPALSFDASATAVNLSAAWRRYGSVEGKAAAIGLAAMDQLVLETTSQEVVATAAIEGEQLPLETVRSSVMRRLGMASNGATHREVDGLVAVIDDATTSPHVALDADRLCRWQAALFPGGSSNLRRIAVGRYRDHADPMQIVSGRPGREVPHYEAPPSSDVESQMHAFLDWFKQTAPDSSRPLEPLARAAIAHLWFESIHPFEGGNGRIGRAIVDLALAQQVRQPARLYSLSSQLLSSRTAYYDALNAAQRGDLDVTAWVEWFVGQCAAAFASAGSVIDMALEKQRFRDRYADADLNGRQGKILQRLLDAGDGGFKGGLNAGKTTKMTGASKATTTRDLADLVAKGLLWTAGTGKAIRYYVAVEGWTHGVDLEVVSGRSAGAASSPSSTSNSRCWCAGPRSRSPRKGRHAG